MSDLREVINERRFEQFYKIRITENQLDSLPTPNDVIFLFDDVMNNIFSPYSIKEIYNYNGPTDKVLNGSIILNNDQVLQSYETYYKQV